MMFRWFMGENFEFSRCDPARKSVPAETRRLVQKRRRYSQKCVLQSLARNQKPKKYFKNLWTWHFTPVPRRPYTGPIFTIFGMWSHTPDVINRSKFQVDCARGYGARGPKIGYFPLTFIIALTTVLRTTVLHCDKDRWPWKYITNQSINHLFESGKSP